MDLSGTPKITLHGFRHSHCTMLNELSPDIKAISDRMGHDDVTTTLKVYIHSNVHSQENLAKLIENEIQKDKQFDDFNLYVEQILKLLIEGLTSDKFTPEEILKITAIYQQVLKLK